MASIECGRGHLYDPEKHPTCPYCNTGRQITPAPAITVTAPQRTAPTAVTETNKTAPLSAVPVTEAQKTAPLSRTPVTEMQKTMPPRGYGERVPTPVAGGGKTVGMMQDKMGFDPVVGWLACVAGPSRGKSYTIRSGINSIGRSERMDIVVTGDLKISAENQAKVSYSDKNNRFMLLPGEGRNITYLNGEEVFAAVPLNAYDIVDFGETKLLFVPLCGESFSWDQEGESGDGNGAV